MHCGARWRLRRGVGHRFDIVNDRRPRRPAPRSRTRSPRRSMRPQRAPSPTPPRSPLRSGVVDPDTTDNASTDVDTLTPLGRPLDHQDRRCHHRSCQARRPPTRSPSPTAVRRRPSMRRSPTCCRPRSSAPTGRASPSGGATCGTPSGSGDVSLLATLPVGGSVDDRRSSPTSIPSATGFVVNTAMVTEPAGVVDTDPANDVGDRQRHADADRRPVDHQDRRSRDGAAGRCGDVHRRRHQQRSVVRSSAHRSTDVMPAGLTGVTWTCAAIAGLRVRDAERYRRHRHHGRSGRRCGRRRSRSTQRSSPSQLGAVTNTATVDAPAGVTDPDGCRQRRRSTRRSSTVSATSRSSRPTASRRSSPAPRHLHDRRHQPGPIADRRDPGDRYVAGGAARRDVDVRTERAVRPAARLGLRLDQPDWSTCRRPAR